MKKRLDHLPTGKREELKLVVEILREGFAEAIVNRTQPRFKTGRLLKIILFGSYARDGEWVEDPIGRYFSDYDILVVVNHEDLTEVPEFWARTEERLLNELTAGTRLRTPVSVIYHDLADVNEQLGLGRYFFGDILRDGIVLFEEPGFAFVEPKPLTADEALRESQEYFEEWLKSADNFKSLSDEAIRKGMSKEAAFLLHQTTERLYHCLFLVLTLYSPKTHNLNQLRRLAEGLDPQLTKIWPTATKFEKRCYELLRAAYVKARYSRHYRITPEELNWLDSRIGELMIAVGEICRARLAELRAAA
jgi:predicted nucleotidyltransferase/HEPN domain-containing protein